MEILTCYVVRFDRDKDDYVRYSVALSLENCRKLLKKLRQRHKGEEFQIIAVLDE